MIIGRSCCVYLVIAHESKQATSRRDTQKLDAGNIGLLRTSVPYQVETFEVKTVSPPYGLKPFGIITLTT
jgi:hypothetical protein